MGDVLCGVPTAVELAKTHDLHWLTLKRYFPLIPPGILPVASRETPHGEIPRDAGSRYDRVINAQPMWHHDEWVRSRKHVLELIPKWAGVIPQSRRITVHVPPTTVSAVDQLKLAPRFVVVCNSPCYSCNNWPPQHRQRVVDHLRSRGLEVVTVGGRDGMPMARCRNLHGRTNMLETVEVVHRAVLYVGPDTGCTWLAQAAHGTKKICLLDRMRFRLGVVGFEKYLDGDETRDVLYQDPWGKLADLISWALQ